MFLEKVLWCFTFKMTWYSLEILSSQVLTIKQIDCNDWSMCVF